MARRLGVSLVAAAFLLSSCSDQAEEAVDASTDVAAGPVRTSELRPCRTTGTQLTVTDCEAAAAWADEARRGTAAFVAPSRMMEGFAATVTLSVGTQAPLQSGEQPPLDAAERPADAVADADASAGDATAGDATAGDSSGGRAPASLPPPARMTPREAVEAARERESDQIVDYHPFVGSKMAAELTGLGFEIEPKGPQIKDVAADGLTTWQWKIRAEDMGRKTLVMRSAVIMIDSQGQANQLKPTEATKQVSVWVGPASVRRVLDAVPGWLQALTAVVVAAGALMLAIRNFPRRRPPGGEE